MKKIFFATILLFLGLGQVWGANGDVLFTQNFNSATAVAYSASTARTYSTSSTLSGLVGNAANLFQGAQCTAKGSTGIAINSSTGGNSVNATGKFQAYANNTGWKWALYTTRNWAAVAPTALKLEMKVTPKYIANKQAVAVMVGSGFSVGTNAPAADKAYTGFNIITNSTGSNKIYIGKTGGTTFICTSTGMTSGTEYTITWVINASGSDLTYTGPDSKSYTLATAKWDMWVGTTRIITGQDRATSGGSTFTGTTMQNLYIGNDVTGKHEVILDDITVTDLSPVCWYTLSYDANGGMGSMPSHEFISGTTVNAAQNTSFTPPSGKIFKCWNTKANGSGTSYAEGASFTLSGNTTLYAQWITASTSGSYCISMYNLSTSDQMKYFTYSGSSDVQILDLEIPSYNTGGNNYWVGNNGSWYNDNLGNSNAKSANARLQDLPLKGNRSQTLGTSAQGVLARFFVYDNSNQDNLYIEFTPKQYSLIWGEDGKTWSPVKLNPSGYENEWTSDVVTLTSDQISSYKYYVGILKADDGVAYWYKSNTSTVGSMGTYNKTTDTWGGNVSTLSAGTKGFFRMWQDATGYDNWRCHFVPVYTFSYNANGGSGAPATIYFASEGDENHRTVYISATEPTRTGYTFAGWATSSSHASAGTVDYEVGDAITISADTELFAVWNCITPDAPTAAKISASDQCQGTGVTFSANTTGLPSYVTWYWQTAADGTSTTYPASSNYTTSTSAGTYTMYLRAKNTACGEWSNSASTPSKSATVYAGTTITTQPTTSVTGHVGVDFTLGATLAATGGGTLTYQWYSYTSSGGAGEAAVGSATTTKTLTTSKSVGTYYYKVKVSGTCGDPVYSNMITVTVDNKRQLTYSANGGSGVPSSGYYAPSASVTLNSTTIPTNSGYVFLGWNTNSSGTGTMYQPGATYTMPSTATTLYAAWGSPCFSFSKGTKKASGWDLADNTYITTELWTASAVLTGGTMQNTSGGTLAANDNYGIVMVKNSKEITLVLTGGQFQEGTVIALEGYTNSNSTVHTYGFSLNGNAVTPLKTATASSYDAYKQRYVVSAGDGIEGTSSCTITMNSSASGSQTYLSALYIGNCVSCTPITPTLNYGTTNLYLEGGANTASPTITGNTGSGAVTYSSSNTSAVDVNTSTGVITAVGAGTATISARIAASGDYCGAVASVNITVPALVEQTVNLGSAWSTVPNMTFPGDPTGTLTKNANIAATGYSIDESNNKSGLSSKIYGIPSSTSKNDNYYMSLKFNTPSYGVRLTSVVVPIQPITNTASAIVTVSDGTTTVTSNEEADIPDGAKKTCTFTITPTTFAAGKTITVKIFVYDQSGDKGFRFGSPILVNGAVITSGFEFTGDGANTNWDTPANWNWGVPPGINNDVVIKKPATVNVTNARAKSVVIYNNGSTKTGQLVLDAGKELVVAGTVRKTTNGSSYTNTGEYDIVFNSNKDDGLGALVMGSHDGTNKATVNFYTKSNGKKNTNTSIAQYVGTPFNDETNILYNWYNSWVYGIYYPDGAINWKRINDGEGMNPFEGYCVFSADAWGNAEGHTYWMQGTLVSSANHTCSGLNWQSGTGTANPNNENLLANSWMAPIKIKAMQSSDFVNADATVYIFNSTDSTSFLSGGFEGNYSTATVGTCEETDLIPAMQSFSVFTTGSSASVTLDYSKIVYTPALAGTTPTPNKAPQRAGVSKGEADKMRLFVRTEDGYGDMLYMWEREDFTEGFENGWDGRKLFGESYAPQLYAITPDGNMAVNCVPDWEGTVLGFKKGTEDNVYTFTFEYEGENTWYLNDLREQTSTLISSESSYMFMASDEDMTARFVISRTPIHHVATEIENTDVSTALPIERSQKSDVKKIVIDDHVFIIRNGQMYDVTGVMVR